MLEKFSISMFDLSRWVEKKTFFSLNLNFLYYILLVKQYTPPYTFIFIIFYFFLKIGLKWFGSTTREIY